MNSLKEQIFAYAKQSYGVEPDYPFPRDDVTCVFRHTDNRKWFGIMMKIPYRTLGMNRDGETDIVNIKCDPVLMGSLRGKPGFRPAYHMNKDKWITILLDGSAGREEVTALVDMSFRMTETKLRKAGHHSEF